MKIKQFSFSLDYSNSSTKNTINSSKNLTPNSLFNSSPHNSPFLNTQSNKRLKYYSSKNKQPSSSIQQNQLQIFKQQFRKFHDTNLKNFLKINHSHKKDVFNLIAKKYYSINKTDLSNKTDTKTKNSKTKKYNKPQLDQKKLSFSQNKCLDYFLKQSSVQFQDNKLRNLDRNLQIIQKNDAQLCPEKVQHFFNEQKYQIEDQIKYDQRRFSNSEQNKTRKVMITNERLKRHRFNKSSISKISLSQQRKQKQIKNDNFLSIDTISSSKQNRNIQKNTKITHVSQQPDFNDVKISKRYVTLKNQSHDTILEINPYTQQKYLHFKLQAQNKQLKTIQKIIKSTCISNMQFSKQFSNNSFKVKSINPETNTIKTSRIQKLSQKEEYLKKIKNLTTMNIRKQIRNAKQKSHKTKDPNEIQGWDFDNKSIVGQAQYL